LRNPWPDAHSGTEWLDIGQRYNEHAPTLDQPGMRT
jgi:hypothetical protein